MSIEFSYKLGNDSGSFEVDGKSEELGGDNEHFLAVVSEFPERDYALASVKKRPFLDIPQGVPATIRLTRDEPSKTFNNTQGSIKLTWHPDNTPIE